MLLKNSLLKAQELFIPYKGKGGRQNKRPSWLNNEILDELKGKKEAYQLWKRGQITIKNYKKLARTCRDAVRRAEDQLELKLTEDVKNNKKGFFRYIRRPIAKQGREASY